MNELMIENLKLKMRLCELQAELLHRDHVQLSQELQQLESLKEDSEKVTNDESV